MELKKRLLFAFIFLITPAIFADDEPIDDNDIFDIISAPADCTVFEDIGQMAVLFDFPETGVDGRLKALLKTRVRGQLKSASIQTASNFDVNCAMLNVQLEQLPTLEPNNCIYRLQLHLKRNASLYTNNSVMPCVVWSSEPLHAMIETHAAQPRLEKALTEQMRALIEAIHICKEDEPEKDSMPKTAIPEKTLHRRREPKPDATKKMLVASKSSTVFHKVDCTSVGRIKEGNAVYYSTREEAANDGKRPCKNCNP